MITEHTENLHVAGMTNLSTIDYPGKPAVVLYFAGCPLKCPYCHNRSICTEPQNGWLWRDVYDELARQSGRKTAVVLSGGEPAAMGRLALCEVIGHLHDLRYNVKLDTSGAICMNTWFCPDQQTMDTAPDYVALDFKAPLDSLGKFTKRKKDAKQFKANFSANLAWLAGSGIGYELRTTVHKRILSEDDVRRMKAEVVKPYGVKCWVLQQFHKADCNDPSLNDEETYSDHELKVLAESVGALVRGVEN